MTNTTVGETLLRRKKRKRGRTLTEIIMGMHEEENGKKYEMTT